MNKLKLALAGLIAYALLVGSSLTLALPMAPGVSAQRSDTQRFEEAYLLCDAWGNCWETNPYHNPPRLNHWDWERALNKGEDYSYGGLTTPDALCELFTGRRVD